MNKYGWWLLWGVALTATLKVHEVSLPVEHGICGPWGCGPPIQALVACHGAWLILLAPVIYLAYRRLSQDQLWWFGVVLVVSGLFGVASVGIYEAVVWFPNATELTRPYFLRRWAFSLAVLIDVPILQLTLIGMGFMLSGRSASGEKTIKQPSSSTGSAELKLVRGTAFESTAGEGEQISLETQTL